MVFNNVIENLNLRIARSFIGRHFRLEGSGVLDQKFSIEIRAGLATFFAMAYIIAVNSSIVSDSGGTCVCDPVDPTDAICAVDPAYLECVSVVKRDIVTATCAIACIACVSLGFLANLPLGIAPGMGLNAYFTYQVVGYHGTGNVSYRQALAAVFVEGLLFVALSILGIRQWLARAIPASIKLAAGAGIGLYLTIIGLAPGAGLGVIGPDSATIVGLGGCPAEYQDETGACLSHKLQSPTMWIGIFLGGVVTAILLMYKVKGAILIGIGIVSITSWPRNSIITQFPHTDAGDANFDFFKKVVTFHKLEKTAAVQDWDFSSGHLWLALITFLYVDIMDTTGTLYSMAKFAGFVDPRTQDFEGSATAYLVDASCISIGSLMGLPPVTAFIESGAGISEGGKTGITAIVIGFGFFISIFFAPIFASIPTWATGSTLVIVGSMMIKSAAFINWDYPGDAIPAFLTIALMPFTYSIAYGLIAGICSYILLNGFTWIVGFISGGRIQPPELDKKEHWTWKLEGGILPPWVQRLSKGDTRFWRTEYVESTYGPGQTVVELPTTRDSADNSLELTSQKKGISTARTSEIGVGEVSEGRMSQSNDFAAPMAGMGMQMDNEVTGEQYRDTQARR
ncbi:hypothetical protein YB2330_005887 [Saitoella coloradoensis]